MARETITIQQVDTSRPNKVGVQDTTNRWFGVFDKALWPRLEQGANLMVEWGTAGDHNQYKNITAILGTGTTSNGTSTDGRRGKEEMIVREVALKAAVELMNGVPIHERMTIEQMLGVADRLVEWLEGTPF